MIHIEELKTEVDDVYDFESEAEELLDAFCEDLKDQPGMTRLWENDDEKDLMEDEGIQYFWSTKASNLIEAELMRLNSIGMKYFGKDEMMNIDIKSSYYRDI